MSDLADVRWLPGWSLVTAVSINLLRLESHQHGPDGTAWVRYEDVVRLVHAVDQARPATNDALLAIVRDVLMDYGDACSGGHDDCLCSMNRLRMAYRARTGDAADGSARHPRVTPEAL